LDVPLQGSSSRNWDDLERRLQILNVRYQRAPWRCFGNEARAALFFRAGLHCKIDSSFAEPTDYKHPALACFLTRPSIEPIVYSSWHRFESWDMDDAWALEITSALTGRKAEHRRRSEGKPPFGDLPAMMYAPLNDSGLWIEASRAVRDRLDISPLKAATLIHAIVILYHPMSDGNGRLARALFHGTLRNRAGIDAPFLALGPISYKLSYHLLRLTRELSQSGDWAGYLHGASRIIESAIENQELFENDHELEAILLDTPC
jgi:hypothetical protein